MSKRTRPLHAASLVLLRPSGRDGAVLMGRRPPTSDFIPDAFVFPGGRIEPEDQRVVSPYPLRPETERALQGVATRRDPISSGLANAAIRETYEETSLMLAQPGQISGGLTPSWQAFSTRGLAPDHSALNLLARAITPTVSPVRYHARFFVARGQDVRGRPRSSDELLDLAWYPIEAARRLPMIDVTAAVLELAARHLDSGDLEDRRQPDATGFIRYRGERALMRMESAAG
ncbi:MAG: NUDIX hydrolase [Myxococcota bacterium]